ncbi:DUF2283 domain-containing protein [Deferrisoma palaeochoriense]
MKVAYYPETDSLYIELSAAPAADSVAVVEGVVIDVDAKGLPVGIGIDPASGVVDLESIDLRLWPGDREKVASAG